MRQKETPEGLDILEGNMYGSSPKELVDEKDSRGQGFKDSSEMLKYTQRGWW
jgi:hypothetical protein